MMAGYSPLTLLPWKWELERRILLAQREHDLNGVSEIAGILFEGLSNNGLLEDVASWFLREFVERAVRWPQRQAKPRVATHTSPRGGRSSPGASERSQSANGQVDDDIPSWLVLANLSYAECKRRAEEAVRASNLHRARAQVYAGLAEAMEAHRVDVARDLPDRVVRQVLRG